MAKSGKPTIGSQRFLDSLSQDGRYRLLVEAVTDYAIYLVDPDGLVTSWNAGAERFKGYRADEVIGKHFSIFYTDEERAAGAPDRALEMAVRDNGFSVEGWRVRKDGTRFWAHVVVDPIYDPKGSLVAFAKITRDITERRDTEEALRKNQEQFKILVEGVTDYAIYMLSPSGIVVSWNTGAERLKGYLPDEIVGRHFETFYTPEDREIGEPAEVLRIATEEGRVEREGWRIRKDGSRFRASVVVDAIYDPDGNLRGFAKVTRDVSERFEAQEALENTREALFQSQKMEAIGQLTGGVAHDFNNILTAVSGGLELALKRLPDDQRLRSLLENAARGIERGVSLTQRMLAFSRRQELNPEPVDLLRLVRSMSDLLERSLGPLIQIDTAFPLSLSWVMADSNQLELALLNLCVNARDAMPTGGTVLISASEKVSTGGTEIPPGKYIQLSVVDTGTGMDEKTLARAIEPFFTTKGVGKGTGLGLSMVHGLAQQSGGQLKLSSRLGEGTTAELWLPVASRASTSTLDREERTPFESSDHRSLTILLVDDDALVLMSTVAMLEDLGHNVLSAYSGSEALDVLKRQNGDVDVLVTDQAMPHMTGVVLAGKARAFHPDLPVIVATGFAELPPEFGAHRLSKPFTQKQLQNAIAETLRNSAS
jgi:PAS domain S-box-containing protein